MYNFYLSNDLTAMYFRNTTSDSKSRLTTPFSESITAKNTALRKIESTIGHTMNHHLIESLQNSGPATDERKESSKERPASVMNK